MDVDNATPFAADRLVLFDRSGREALVAVVKATYDLRNGRDPESAEEQDPIVPADRYAGEPGKSGMVAEGELVAPKPSTDVLLSAHALAPKRGTRAMRVEIRVGNRHQSANVYGDRVWISSLGFDRISKPEVFDRIPLVWERAFGGTDTTPAQEKHHEWWPENPVGMGFFAAKSKRNVEGEPVPNVEHPATPYRGHRDRPPSVGFLPVAPVWEPRRRFAGTYDEAWMEARAPLLPDDFDERFRLTAPRGLRGEGYLRGGERCEVAGTTRAGTLRFALPRDRPTVRLVFPKGSLGVAMNLDTVHVDTDRMRLHLVWRGAHVVGARVDALRIVEVREDDGTAR